MANFIITGISALIQIFITAYMIFSLSEITNNQNLSKKTKIVSTAIFSIGGIVSAYVDFPNVIFKILVCALPSIIVQKYILHSSWVKSIFITISIFISFLITELLAMIIVCFIFNCTSYDILASNRLLFSLLFIQIIILLIILKIVFFIIHKSYKFKELANNATSTQILDLTIIISICILPNILITLLNSYDFNFIFLLVYCIETIVVAVTIFIFFKRTLERDKAQSELVISELHNKTMINMVDNVRTLKHDYTNIIESLNGYAKTKQYDKLEDHIDKILKECNVTNNLSAIKPEIFNEPAIYGIVGAKYFHAIEKDITFDIKVTSDFSKINFSIPELSRILGILLDNAIEATENLKDKYIRFEVIYDERKNADVIKVINTYNRTNEIDLTKIYDKGFSSKKIKSGIGLFEVKKLVSKNKNAEIYPEIKNGKFVHTLIIDRIL